MKVYLFGKFEVILACTAILTTILLFLLICPHPTPNPPPPDITTWKTYKNEQNGFEFKYPEKLRLTVNDNIVTLNHSIPFKNYGDCDMSGGSKLYENLNDFNVTFELKPSIITPDYTDGNYNMGILNGVWQYYGVEGCGSNIYYFQTPGDKTLIVKKDLVQAFTGISTMWNVDEILKIPGVITKEESNQIFDLILSTFKFLPDTTNWSTYKNFQYGFEFNYPQNWFISYSQDNSVFISSTDPQGGGNFAGFRVEVNDSGKPLPRFEYLSKTSVIIGGVSGYKLVPDSAPENLQTTEYYAAKGNFTYIISASEDLGYPGRQEREIDNQILSTFKFIKPTTDTSDWITYTNPGYNFQISYPPSWSKEETGLPPLPNDYSFYLIPQEPSVNRKIYLTVQVLGGQIAANVYSQISNNPTKTLGQNLFYTDGPSVLEGMLEWNYYYGNSGQLSRFNLGIGSQGDPPPLPQPEQVQKEFLEFNQILSTFRFTEPSG